MTIDELKTIEPRITRRDLADMKPRPPRDSDEPELSMPTGGARTASELAPTQRVGRLEGGGLQTPGEYEGHGTAASTLMSLGDPGVWMEPSNLAAMVAAGPLQKLLPGGAKAARIPAAIKPPPLRGAPSMVQALAGGNPFAPVESGFTRAKAVAKAIRNGMSPASASEDAGWTARRFRAMGGELHVRTVQAEAQLKEAVKHFDRAPRSTAYEFMHNIETGTAQATPEQQGMADAIDTMFTERVRDIQKLGTGAMEHVRDNYFPHIWERLGGHNPQAAQTVAGLYAKKPLAGSAHFTKKRLIGTIAEGLDLKDEMGAPILKLVSENPAELALMHVREMDHFLMGQQLFQEMKAHGLAKWGSGFGKPFPEWVELNDKIARRTFRDPATKLPVMAGKYYAPPDVARVFNNYLSPGMRGNPVYDLANGVNNKMNSIQLGMSAYHLTAESINAAISEVGLGMTELLQPGVGGQGWRLKGLARAARGMASGPVETFARGDTFIRGVSKPGAMTGPLAEDIDRLIKAGGRTGMDSIYRTDAAKGFWSSLRKAPFGTLLEKASWPIMGYAVPRLKVGAFLRLAESELARSGESASTEAGKKILTTAWDSIDNRFGQMVYDNLFWDRMWKDAAHLAVRSVGWNLGDIREVGGAVAVDIPKQVLALAKGQPAKITPRQAFTIALPAVTAVYGSIAMYLMTGHGPESLFDAINPRTGLLRPDGSEDRLTQPTYMKDYYAVTNDPIATATHKMSPLISDVVMTLQNKDFYGDPIRNPEEGYLSQAWDLLKYQGEQARPFAVQGAVKELKQGGDWSDVLRSFLGYTPAPQSIVNPEKMKRWQHRQLMQGLRRKKKREQRP